MAVFRVEKNKGYTVMSNHHLRNKELSLKAKGLLSQMLSLPEDWDYTLAGLSLINREKIDAIREAVRELENAGYIQRSRERDEKGCLRSRCQKRLSVPLLPVNAAFAFPHFTPISRFCRTPPEKEMCGSYYHSIKYMKYKLFIGRKLLFSLIKMLRKDPTAAE